ncbi:FecR domain-containing protein [Fulvivirgaceae bacterium BMA12]|uniref:FecR domain-containing protein n=1 Tax=Agaribacillus aureus TaxID=3051825 RepID=A0ABT8LHT3_9BACT|nr:FecR domain-containing protein [Fulvivirgaceae bacterium BMA12]
MSLEKKVNIQQLYKKYLDGSASKEEFNEYLDGVVDPDQSLEMRQLIDQAWKKEYAGKKPVKTFPDDHKRKVVRQALVNAQIEGKISTTNVSRKNNSVYYRAAAMITFFLVVTAAFLMYRFQVFGGYESANIEIIETVPKEKSTILLPDGSLVHLNSVSKLTFPKAFDGDTREIVLEGEAFFEVARDETKPFVVRSGGLVTTVLGTSFNINAYGRDKEIQVAVVSGKVSVAKANDMVSEPHTLMPNNVAVYDTYNKAIRVDSRNTNELIAWREGVLKFDKVPLSQVAVTLERWYGLKVTLENKQLGNCLIYGEFKNEPIEQVMKTLQSAINIEFEINSEGVKVGGAGC